MCVWPNHVTHDWHMRILHRSWSVHLQYNLSFYIFSPLHIFFLLYFCPSLFSLSDIILYYESLVYWTFFISFFFIFFLPFYPSSSFTFPVLRYSAYFTYVFWTVLLNLLFLYNCSPFSKALQILPLYSCIHLLRNLSCIISIAFQSEFPTQCFLVLHVPSALTSPFLKVIQ